ncbi:MAG: thiazole synthase [Desulfobacterota bacterium]|nr:thiazole synthase [Thermodesulfobacteriota bacterium]
MTVIGWKLYRLSEEVDVAPLVIAGKKFRSRLFVGTGKYPSPAVLAAALEASGTELVTVALRRISFDEPDPTLSAIDFQKYLVVPNTSGAKTADEAVRLARLARAASGLTWIKLEVTPDPVYLLPDPAETLKAAEILVHEGFTVLPYIHADPTLAKRLEDVGCAAVMPLGSPIGSARGIKTEEFVKIIVQQASVPVVVDAGLGLPSHAAQALELGADAVLVNTAIAVARDPVRMAHAFRLAVESAEAALDAGPIEQQDRAVASSPLTGFLDS